MLTGKQYKKPTSSFYICYHQHFLSFTDLGWEDKRNIEGRKQKGNKRIQRKKERNGIKEKKESPHPEKRKNKRERKATVVVLTLNYDDDNGWSPSKSG